MPLDVWEGVKNIHFAIMVGEDLVKASLWTVGEVVLSSDILVKRLCNLVLHTLVQFSMV